MLFSKIVVCFLANLGYNISKTEKHLADAPAAFDEAEADPNTEKLWQAYQKKFSYAADLSWHTVMESIRSLYELAQG